MSIGFCHQQNTSFMKFHHLSTSTPQEIQSCTITFQDVWTSHPKCRCLSCYITHTIKQKRGNSGGKTEDRSKEARYRPHDVNNVLQRETAPLPTLSFKMSSRSRCDSHYIKKRKKCLHLIQFNGEYTQEYIHIQERRVGCKGRTNS